MASEAIGIQERELTIARTFDAPRSVVFEAWTKPEHLAHWWGPRGYSLPTCKMDFRIGGTYRFCMKSPDGNEFWVGGVYREIVVPERIVWTGHSEMDGKTGPETVMTVTFEERAGKTTVKIHQTFEAIETAQGVEGGWKTSLDRLAAYLANR